jgi:hypothetical protein
MNDHLFNVVPECYADTMLVNLLGFQGVNHALNSNVSYVQKTIKARKPHEKWVGIIDSDRGRQEKLLDDFTLESEEQHIKKYVNGARVILVLCPALETWIYQNAEQVGVSPEKYGFQSPKYFRDSCKDMNAKQNQELKQFLNTLKQKNAPGFVQLKSWICAAIGIAEDELA